MSDVLDRVPSRSAHRAPRGRAVGGGALAGTGVLARLALRRDRVRLPVWVVLLAMIVLVTPGSFASLFPDDAARAGYAAGVEANPALRAVQGPIFGSDLGALTAGRTLALVATLVAVMAVLTVVRHTRAEEEAGRRELLGATAVGRQAGLAAALAVAGGAAAVLALAVTVGLVAAGLPFAGSAAMGLALLGTGLVFAAVAAVAAQLTEGARAASGIALGTLGVLVVLRAAGDAGTAEWPAWLSPFGWAVQVRPFAGDRWWVLALPLALTAVLVAVAFALSSRRDLAAGVLPPRLGPATAPASLSGPFGLAWRLQRGALLGWTAAFVVAGAAFGGIAQGVSAIVDSSPEVVAILRQLGGPGGLVDVFLAAEFGVLGLLASAYAISAALRLRSEETDGRAEVVLATATARSRWVASHLVVALLGPAVALLGAGLGAGVVRASAVGDPAAVGTLVRAALLQLPAVWVLVGIALALFGALPRLVVGAWAALVVFLLFGQFGQVLQLPQWLLDVSPFTHLPRILGADVAVAPLVWLVVVAAALVAAGFAAFRRRDLG